MSILAPTAHSLTFVVISDLAAPCETFYIFFFVAKLMDMALNVVKILTMKPMKNSCLVISQYWPEGLLSGINLLMIKHLFQNQQNVSVI